MRNLTIGLAAVVVLVFLWMSGRAPVSPLAEPPNPDTRGSDRSTEERFIENPGEVEAWLKRAESSVARTPPRRNIFQKEDSEAKPGPSRTTSPTEPAPEPVTPLPRLLGFVVSGREGSRGAPLAMILVEGKTWLVGPGDSVGVYRVETLVAWEEVVLVDRQSGGRLRLVMDD